ncbi:MULTISPECIES: hypothetical protein [unclassified Mesorhizobium]
MALVRQHIGQAVVRVGVTVSGWSVSPMPRS